MRISSFIGMRTFKTGIAVVITAALGHTFLVSNAFYAVIGTIFALQNTMKSSLVAGKNRLLGTVLGAIIGYLFALFQLNSPLFVGIAMIVTIVCCNRSNIDYYGNYRRSRSAGVLVIKNNGYVDWNYCWNCGELCHCTA